MKLFLKIFFGGMSLYMIIHVVMTSLKEDMWAVLPELNAYLWFQTTIIDFYFNVAIIAAWMIYKERIWWKITLWIVSFICLGSIATAFYAFLQVLKLKEDDGMEQLLLRN